MKTFRFSPVALALLAAAAHAQDWQLGPFTRPPNAEPVIKPQPASVFQCPMRQAPVHWEIKHTFNPAAVVKDGKIWVLYRAEDDSGARLGGYTSRLGLASSDDGIHFDRRPEPVLYPDNDAQKDNEWEGGCEDPRCVETEDGKFIVFYTAYHRPPTGPARVGLGAAVSADLIHWTKLGLVQGRNQKGDMVTPRKSASLVCALRDGRLVAAKINGRYWLYYGEGTLELMSSPDLRAWTPVENFAVPPRPGLFDSDLVECGPPAVLTDRGIVLLYNGKNAGGGKGDESLKGGVYSNGQLLFDAHDPAKILERSRRPFFKPELPWEITGQYGAGTTFIEGLAHFHDRWFLYYGCADSFVGVAMTEPK